MKTDMKKVFENISHITFMLYIITLYIFETRAETLIWSQLCFLLFAGCSTIYLLLNGRIFIHAYFLFMGMFVFYCLISYFWSIDQDVSFTVAKTLLQLFLLSVLIYHVFYLSGRMDIFIMSLLAAGLVLCVYAVYIYSWSGFLNALMTGNVRLGAEISQENVMGMQAAITFILCIYYALFKGKKVFFLISVAPFLLGMASGSKKAILIIAVGMVLLLYLKTGLKKIYKFAIYTFIVFLIFEYAIELPAFTMMNHRLEQFYYSIAGGRVNEMSTIVRQQMITFGLDKFYEAPVIGYGIGSSSMLYLISFNEKTYLHCNFVDILASGGIIGFLLYYSMFAYIVFKLIPLIKVKNTEAIIITIILISRLFCDIASVSYYDKLTWVYLIMGFLIVAVKKKKDVDGYEIKQNT